MRLTETEAADDQIMLIATEALRLMEQAPEELIIMGAWDQDDSCRTAHCIGGWMGIASKMIAHKDINNYPACSTGFTLGDRASISMRSRLNHLFYMLKVDEGMETFDRLPPSIRKKLALQALKNFIEHDDPKWPELMEEF